MIANRKVWCFVIFPVVLFGLFTSHVTAQDAGQTDASSRYRQEVLSLLNKGLDGSTQEEELSRHYQAARRLNGQDPRVYFSCGLACLKRGKGEAAERQFELATQQIGSAYPAAWQMLIRQHAANKQYFSCLTDLLALTEILEEQKYLQTSAAGDAEYAAWAGRMVGFLEQTAKVLPHLRDSLLRRDAEIREVLTDTRRAAYDSGRRTFLEEHARDTKDAEERRQEAEKRRAEIGQGRQDRAGRLLDEVDDEKSRIEEQRREVENGFEEGLKKFDEAEYELTKALQGWQTQAQLAQNKLATSMSLPGPKPLELMGQLKRDHEYAQRNVAECLGKLEILRAQRATFMGHNQVMGLQMEQRRGSTQDAEERAKRAQGYAEKLRGKKKPAASVATADVASSATYFPVDFESERTRLLASFDTPRRVDPPSHSP